MEFPGGRNSAGCGTRKGHTAIKALLVQSGRFTPTSKLHGKPEETRWILGKCRRENYTKTGKLEVKDTEQREVKTDKGEETTLCTDHGRAKAQALD